MPAQAAPLRLGPPEWGLIGLQSMLWGSAFFFIAIANTEIPALTIVAGRILPALAVLLSVLFFVGQRLPATWSEWRILLLFSAFNNVLPILLIIWAQREVTGGMAAIFNATAPLFGVFLAHALTADEKLSLAKVLGILVGISGVAVLVGADLSTANGGSLAARIALISAALCYAASNIFVRVWLSHYPPFTMAAVQMVGALVVSLPLALAIDQPWTQPAPSWAAIGAVIGMGVFGSGLSSLCHFTVLQRAGAVNAMIVTLIMPVTPIILGGIFLGDRLGPRDIAGAAIIALALVISDGRLLAALRRPKTKPRA